MASESAASTAVQWVTNWPMKTCAPSVTVFVASAGVRAGEPDPFVEAVLADLERDADLIPTAQQIADQMLKETPELTDMHMDRWFGHAEGFLKT